VQEKRHVERAKTAVFRSVTSTYAPFRTHIY
jgi:hypothetical protein